MRESVAGVLLLLAPLAAQQGPGGRDPASERELLERRYETLERVLPPDHPDLRSAAVQLAEVRRQLGDAAGALRLARERARLARQRLAHAGLSPREIGVLAVQERPALDLLLVLVGDNGFAAARPELAGDALVVSEALRGAAIRQARGWHSARADDPQRSAVLERQLQVAAAQLARVRQDPSRRREDITGAIVTKEQIERELAALAAKKIAATSASAADLSKALPERSAAAAIVAFAHQRAGDDEQRLAALVLDREARTQLVPLGAVAEVRAEIERLRAAVQPRGVRGSRLLDPPGSDDAALTVASGRLRELVVAPLLRACGAIDTLYVSVDEVLELVPLDALPFEEGLLGERVSVRSLVSLFDLLEPQGAEPGDAPALLVAGGLDFGGGEWPALPGTAREADEVAALFQRAFPGGKREQLAGKGGGKAAVLAGMRTASVVHLATHAFFAPEREGGGEDAITALSPLALAGLALSGGEELTAEEIVALDLSRCRLAVLAAGDTSLGVRRDGQGYASLRAALQGAGARFVLTALWKVGDAATAALMADFYERMWVEKKDPHTALWEAKMAARRKGAAFRDWAAWVPAGR
jgi:CHAT domain-containing protein